MHNKEVTQGHEGRLRILKGINRAVRAVNPSLGAMGRSAGIEFKGLDPILSDDGITILKNLKFSDPYEQMGLDLVRKGAMRTSIEGGDGTATTTNLIGALCNQAMNEIAYDSSKIREIKERLDKGLDVCLKLLADMKEDVKEDDIERIATISSLDAEVAKLIADIIKEVGVNGVVTVEKGAKIGYSKEVVKGAKFDKGFISQYFINEPATQSVVLNDPYIILVDRVISTNEQILSLLNSIGTGNDILIIADAVQSVALGTLAQNAVNKIANIACVANPYTASRAKEFLFDMAALTGATVISEEKGMKLDTSTVEVCGRAEKVVVTEGTTTIIGGKSGEALQQRIASIEQQIESTTSEYSKAMLEDRLACLTGGIGVIRVGAYTDTDFNAKKYKFENAINATQAALQEGVVAGGGTALAKVSKKIEDRMFSISLVSPIMQMAENAGMDQYEVRGEVAGDYPLTYGYNFITKEFGDMIDFGIIDPFKVTRLALEAAVFTAKSLINIDPVIVDEEEKE